MAQQLQRELSNRHIQLIAIGGAIGTGLFRFRPNHFVNWPFHIIGIYDYWHGVIAFMRALGVVAK